MATETELHELFMKFVSMGGVYPGWQNRQNYLRVTFADNSAGRFTINNGEWEFAIEEPESYVRKFDRWLREYYWVFGRGLEANKKAPESNQLPPAD